jgi:alpha-glucosidase
LRAAHEALSMGTYEPVVMTGDLLAYVRRSSSEALLIALNLGAEPVALALSSLRMDGRTLLSTYVDDANQSSTDTIGLRANEGVIVMLAP